MSLANPFQLGKRYSFELYANAVLSTTIKNAKVTSIVSGPIAEQLNHQVATKHAQIYPSLPEETSERDYTSQHYVIVEYDNGETDAFGLSWIRNSTIKMLSSSDYIVQLKNVSPDAAEALNAVLSANGYQVARIEQVESSLP